jgi:hypothetical protein
MKTVTMLEFRKNAEGILRRVGRGERFVLSHTAGVPPRGSSRSLPQPRPTRQATHF